MKKHTKPIPRFAAAAAVALLLEHAASAQSAARHEVNIPAKPIASALKDLAAQTGLQVLVFSADAGDIQGPAVQGNLTNEEALAQLLRNSGLIYQKIDDHTVAVRAVKSVSFDPPHETANLGAQEISLRLAQADTPSPSQGEGQGEDKTIQDESQNAKKGIPEILVRGARSLNADIQRTEDDIQPYVVFSAEAIARSQVNDLESFLKANLPMNTASFTLAQTPDSPNINSGQINLRGLGTEQTLVLVDGRRLPGASSLSSDILQPSLLGIPTSSIERIEVLPATASGIYGGGATGGVINIIRKHDYKGLDIGVKYGNTFESGVRSVDVNLNGGLSLDRSGTNLTFSASHSESKPLFLADRDFSRKARELLLANNPDAVANQVVPPAGGKANVCGTHAEFFEGYGYFGVCDGTPLTLTNGQALGAPITSAPAGYAVAGAQAAGAGFAENAGRYNLGVPDVGQYLLRTPVTNSASIGVRQSLGERLEIFLDGAFGKSESDQSSGASTVILTTLPAGAAGNPFSQDITVTSTSPDLAFPAHSSYETMSATAGLIVHLPRSWAATFEGGWGRSRSSFDQTVGAPINAAGAALLQTYALQDLSAYPVDLSQFRLAVPDRFGGPLDTILKTASTRISGPIFDLPAGSVSITGLVERREETARAGFTEQNFNDPPDSPSLVTLYPERSRKVQSYYVETQLPIVSVKQGFELVRDLDFQLSVRRDEYETQSTQDRPTAETHDGPFAAATYFTNEVASTDYTVGFRLRPVRDITVRASFGTGFMAPLLSQITQSSLNQTFPGPGSNPADPQRGGTPLSVPRVQLSGGNPGLNPERSKSWSAGLILTPRVVEALRLSVDYTRVRKSDEIYQPSVLEILGNESLYPGRIVRGTNLPGDAAGWAGPVTQIDLSAINLSYTHVNSIDYKADYKWSVGSAGTVYFSGIATQMKQLERQLNPTSAPFDMVGYTDGPLKWRGQLAVSWERGPWLAAWNTQYYDAYLISYGLPGRASLNASRIANQGAASVAPQIFHDVFFSYQIENKRFASLLDGATFSIGVRNVFNSSPEILAPDDISSFSSSDYSSYGDPRLRQYLLSVRKSF